MVEFENTNSEYWSWPATFRPGGVYPTYTPSTDGSLSIIHDAEGGCFEREDDSPGAALGAGLFNRIEENRRRIASGIERLGNRPTMLRYESTTVVDPPAALSRKEERHEGDMLSIINPRTRQLMALYVWTGGAWIREKYSSLMIPEVDIGSLRATSATIDDLMVNQLTGKIANIIKLDVSHLTASEADISDLVAKKIASHEIVTNQILVYSAQKAVNLIPNPHEHPDGWQVSEWNVGKDGGLWIQEGSYAREHVIVTPYLSIGQGAYTFKFKTYNNLKYDDGAGQDLPGYLSIRLTMDVKVDGRVWENVACKDFTIRGTNQLEDCRYFFNTNEKFKGYTYESGDRTSRFEVRFRLSCLDQARDRGRTFHNVVRDITLRTGVVTSDIEDGAVTTTTIRDGAITTGKIMAGAVSSDKIEAHAVTADKIQTGAVRAEHIQAGAIRAGAIRADAIDGMTITGATLQTNRANRGMKIIGDQIVQYDSNGVRRFEMGAYSTNWWAADGKGCIRVNTQSYRDRVAIYFGSNATANWDFGGDMFVSALGETSGPNPYRVPSLVISGPEKKINNSGRAGLELGDGWNWRLGTHYGRSDRAGEIENHHGVVSICAGSKVEIWGKYNNSNTYSHIVFPALPSTSNLIPIGVPSGKGWRVYYSSSAARYKMDIKNVAVDPYLLLDVVPRDWVDLGEQQAYLDALERKTLSAELGKDMTSDDDEGVLGARPRRVPGLVAEEVEAAGLGQFVHYQADGKTQGLMYDRLWTLLIPIVKDLRQKVQELERRA